MKLFQDRSEAGKLLATKLTAYADRRDVLVLGLPRGGIPVAFEVAKALGAPLDAIAVRKLGVPGQEELAMGAIALGGVRVLNASVVRSLDIADEVIDRVAASEERELERRERLYRGDKPALSLTDRTIIIVDDGLATGSTMRAAVEAIEQHQPAGIVIAIPIGAPEICKQFQSQVDEVVCYYAPERLWAVARGYLDFAQTTDEEVCRLLEGAKKVLNFEF